MTLPKTPQTQQAKADLLAAMEDHYHALIEEGKSEHEAIGAVISEFGSIDELKEELELGSGPASQATTGNRTAADGSRKADAAGPENSSNATAGTWPDETAASEGYENRADHKQKRGAFSSADAYASAAPVIEVAEAEAFWQLIRRFALKIAGGVLTAALGIAAVVFFGSHGSNLVGLTGLFSLAAIAVGLFITGGMSYSDAAKRLEDRPIAAEVREAANLHTAQYNKSFRFSLVLGIMICILSFVPLFFFGSLYGGYNEGYGVAFFLGIAGLGAFLIIYGSIVYSYYKKFADQVIFISDEDAPSPNARRHHGEEEAVSPIFEAIEKVYWPLVLVLYFWWSFNTGSWAWSWVIFMIAGPVFAAIRSLFRIKD